MSPSHGGSNKSLTVDKLLHVGNVLLIPGVSGTNMKTLHAMGVMLYEVTNCNVFHME